ncbi:MAG: PEP-CTERM sorting domain-containing protein [Sphingobacteriales bacterium]|nr:MAG: PEP-CTERM sorting domain-containing protein [Sphingobacteriales bacterium]
MSSIELGGQSDAYIDDLSFYYAGEAVPEPSSIILMMMGVLGVFWRKIGGTVCVKA